MDLESESAKSANTKTVLIVSPARRSSEILAKAVMDLIYALNALKSISSIRKIRHAYHVKSI